MYDYLSYEYEWINAPVLSHIMPIIKKLEGRKLAEGRPQQKPRRQFKPHEGLQRQTLIDNNDIIVDDVHSTLRNFEVAIRRGPNTTP